MKQLIKWFRTRYFKWTEREIAIPVESIVETERLGTSYGGWIIPAGWLKEQSVCYLVGAGLDISFDLAVADRYQSEVHIFDPTPGAIDHVTDTLNRVKEGLPAPCPTSPGGFYPNYPPTLPTRIQVHPYGLWNKDETLRFFRPVEEDHISHSLVNLQGTEQYIEVPVRRLSHIMEDMGHQHIDLLKIDIEGAEYQVLESIVNDGLSIDILCIEYDETASNHLDGKYIDRIERSLQQLREVGFRVIAREPGCHNYSLVHQRRLQG